MRTSSILCFLGFMVTACGSDASSSAVTAPASHVGLSGVASALRVPATESLPNFTDMTLQVYDATSLSNAPVAGVAPTATPLYSGSLPAAAASCATSGCPWKLPEIVVAGAGPSLVARVWGADSSAQNLWAPVYSIIVDADALTFSQKHGSALAATAPAYALSNKAVAQIASLVGLSSDALLAQGLVIGMVVGQDASNQAGGLPAPVTGARVTLTAAQANLVTLYYPNAAYTQATEATSTNSDGFFWLVGNSATGPSLGMTSVAVASSGSGLSWAGRQLALLRNSIMVAPLAALP